MVTFVLTKKPLDTFRLSCRNIRLFPWRWLTVSSDVRTRKRLTTRGVLLVLNVLFGAAVTGSPGNWFTKTRRAHDAERTQQIVAREPRLRFSQDAFVIQRCRY